jgi:hypothetical protein
MDWHVLHRTTSSIVAVKPVFFMVVDPSKEGNTKTQICGKTKTKKALQPHKKIVGLFYVS